MYAERVAKRDHKQKRARAIPEEEPVKKGQQINTWTSGMGWAFVNMFELGMHPNENSWPKPNKMKHWAESQIPNMFFLIFSPYILPISFTIA